ncbi:MAG: deoxyribose-phosphate aldolase [Chloroflexi bacterium]|nr:deoxyribose-phosphate aldolase [Chloroflexota bacterium]MDL1885426.1 deoxyribose-phosphate aldolase [Anaerolineae bacterium CFX8]
MSNLSPADLAGYIQYTLVRPDATRDEMVAHLETSAKYRFHAAMISMCWVPLAVDILRGTGVRVATCIGLSMGHESLHAKIGLVRECLALGAEEIDYEPNMGFFLSGMYDAFQQEAAELVKAAEGRPIKAMLELGYIREDRDRRLAARLLDEAGLPWVKNSSGVGPGSEPATPENIRLLRETVSARCQVKASGKITGYKQALALIEAGAALLGTSAGAAIVAGAAALDKEAGY